MLQAVNNVYLVDMDGAQTTSINYARFLLYSLFIQKLEKAFLLGLPKVYQIKHHHDSGLRGRVHISGMIKHDMPYKGKLSSQQRVRTVDEAIISVLNTAVKRVFNEYKQAAQNIRHVSTALRQLNPKKLQKETMANALSSKALTNPIFAPYKQVLSLAKLIIEQQNIKPAKTDKTESYGFLVNVAELFELYVKSLLQKNFPDWSVDSPKIKLYGNQFYSRHIIPDIVMRKGNKVAVFDTKYKRMNYQGTNQNGMGDVDRADFFQIHTYMSYYQSQADIEFIGGGLLYPLSKAYNDSNCFSSKQFENNQAWFLVDGIEMPSELEAQANIADKNSKKHSSDELLKNQSIQVLISAEQAFINRMRKRLEV
jgi:5-methylcytosine-specific restriction endonuclease McrBC regulatory subunit McrC